MFPAFGNGAAPNGQPVVGAGQRHPLDPDPVPSTKAMAVQWLGILALALSPVLAGVVPAALALLMARETTAQMRASEGFLTGVRALHIGVRLARMALLVVVAVLVVAVVVALLRSGGAGSGTVHYSPDVN